MAEVDDAMALLSWKKIYYYSICGRVCVCLCSTTADTRTICHALLREYTKTFAKIQACAPVNAFDGVRASRGAVSQAFLAMAMALVPRWDSSFL